MAGNGKHTSAHHNLKASLCSRSPVADTGDVYVVPKWFLDNHISTPSELETIGPKLVLIEKETADHEKEDDKSSNEEAAKDIPPESDAVKAEVAKPIADATDEESRSGTTPAQSESQSQTVGANKSDDAASVTIEVDQSKAKDATINKKTAKTVADTTKNHVANQTKASDVDESTDDASEKPSGETKSDETATIIKAENSAESTLSQPKDQVTVIEDTNSEADNGVEDKKTPNAEIKPISEEEQIGGSLAGQEFKIELSKTTYAALRDAAASIFVPDEEKRSVPPGLLLRGSKTGSFDVLASIVRHVAGDLKATLVTLDSFILEDLAWQIDHDLAEEAAKAPPPVPVAVVKPNVWLSLTAPPPPPPPAPVSDSGYDSDEKKSEADEETQAGGTNDNDQDTADSREIEDEEENGNQSALSRYFFGTDSKSEEAQACLDEAVSTLMEAVKRKASSGAMSTSTETENDNPKPARILLHLRGLNYTMEDGTTTSDRLAKFLKAINKWQDVSCRVATILDLGTDRSPFNLTSAGACTCSSCVATRPKVTAKEEEVRKELGIDAATVFDFDADFFRKHRPYYQEKGSPLKQDVNTRLIRQNLRKTLPKRVKAEFADPAYAWDFVYEDDKYPFMGEHLLTEDKLKQLATQLKGRALEKDFLDLDDLKAVLARVSEKKDIKKESKDEKKSDKDKSAEFKKRLDKIRDECDTYETGLIDCVVDPGTLESSYDDVILEQELKDNIHYLVNVSRLRFEGNTHRLLKKLQIKGALFYGPPGTGKTHLCRAVAKSSGSNMLMIDAADIEQKYVGESEKTIKAVFSLARKLHPCILFIDEVDSLFRHRQDDDKPWVRNNLTLFLQGMDGLTADNKSPFVIVASNRPQDLDEAFLRRLPQKVLFKLPAADERKSIVQLHVKPEDLDDSISIEDIVSKTKGYSGSDLNNLCQSAAWIWMREQLPTGQKAEETVISKPLKLTKAHFTKALEQIKASVSEHSQKEYEGFARRFNPGGVPEETSVSHLYI